MKKYVPLILLCLILAGWVMFFDRVTDHLVFQPTRQIFTLQLPFEEVNFPSKNGKMLNGLYLPARAGKPTILFFHGRSYNIYNFQDFARIYADKGYGVFMFDFQGYGKSAGKPSQKNFYEDSSAALLYLMLQKQVMPKSIVLWGFSLGNAPALYIASKYAKLPFKGVVLQSPFTTVTEVGFYMLAQKYDESTLSRIVPMFLKPILYHKNFNNLDRIANVRAPMLVAYSQQDTTIPWTMSHFLASRAPKGTKMISSPTGVHHSFEWIRPYALTFLENLDKPEQK